MNTKHCRLAIVLSAAGLLGICGGCKPQTSTTTAPKQQATAASSADIKEVQRLGQKFKEKVESSFDKYDSGWIKNVALTSALFAQETSLIDGVKWTERYTPKAPDYTPGTGKPEMVGVEVLNDRIRTLVLNPDVSVGEVTPDDYTGLLKQVLSEEDLKSFDEIRKRTGCWEKFRKTLEASAKKEEK